MKEKINFADTQFQSRRCILNKYTYIFRLQFYELHRKIFLLLRRLDYVFLVIILITICMSKCGSWCLRNKYFLEFPKNLQYAEKLPDLKCSVVPLQCCAIDRTNSKSYECLNYRTISCKISSTITFFRNMVSVPFVFSA